MDLAIQIVSGLLVVAGIVGCLLPFLPGPPISYIALILLQLQTNSPFTTKFMIIWAVITVGVTVLDFFAPVWSTKKWGGTKYGMWGCAIGLIAGFWFGPAGIIAGPFVGALLGEMLYSKNSDIALKAAVGSFFGFLFGTIVKLIASTTMFYYYIISL